MSLVDEIRSSITITDLWLKLGLPGEPKPGMNLCPFHQERSPSLSIYEKNTRFKCFGCGEGGSVIDLFKVARGLATNRDAVVGLAEFMSIEKPEYKRLVEPAKTVVQKVKDVKSGDQFGEWPSDEYMEWAAQKGITRDTIEYVMFEGSLYFKKGRPVYRYNSGEKTRYDMRDSSSSRWIAGGADGGLWRFMRLRSWKVDVVFLCEGESDTMAMMQHVESDRIACVGIPQASFIPNRPTAALIGSNRTVVLCFDNDNAGRIAEERIRDAINAASHKSRVIVFPWEDGDPKDLCALGKDLKNKVDSTLQMVNNTSP